MTNKTVLYEQLKDALPVEFNDNELEEFFFIRKDSVRLTYQGCLLMSKVFDSYRFKHNDDFLTKHLIAISREFSLPYYLSKTQLIVFSSADASMITLCGDIKTFLERLT